MPHGQWSPKRERQYEHIKDSLKDRGKDEELTKEIAARSVNKQRAQHGEARTATNATLEDMPAPRRGGLRSHKDEQGRTYSQLNEEARNKGMRSRSTMRRADLDAALRR